MLSNVLGRWGQMGQARSNEGYVHSPATRPSVGSAALNAPTISPFVALMEAIRTAAAASARCWPSMLDKISRELGDHKDRPARKRDNDHAARHDSDH